MAKLLFNLHNVPDDEAIEVRQVLLENDIRFYETSRGFFGTGAAAIWLSDDSQQVMARSLLDSYQADRTRAAREAADNHKIPLSSRIKQHPVRYFLSVVFILVVLYVSVVPFWGLI